MRLVTIAALASQLALHGCAVLTAAPTPRAATMRSPPPEPKADVTPHPTRGQAWVPGFYEPTFGAWVWRPGRIVHSKPGYHVVEAKYVEEAGEFHVRLPHWEPQRLADLK